MTLPRLWQIEVSLYSEKVRWALAYKNVTHTRREPLAGTHRAVALGLTAGKHDRLPVLTTPDGRNIGDSTPIIAWLESEYPKPPLYPADASARTKALELENFFDEELGPHMRRACWLHILDDDEALTQLLMPRASATRQRLLKATAPLARPILRLDYTITPEAAAESVQALHRALDVIEAELGDGDYLVGDSFTVADLTGAALLTPLICPPGREYPPGSVPDEIMELRAAVEARPGGQWVHEMYARHRGLPSANRSSPSSGISSHAHA